VVPTLAPVIAALTLAVLLLPAFTDGVPLALPLYAAPTVVSAACAPEAAAISAIATAVPTLLRLNMGARAARLWILRAFMS
jgi:hypothetical protein